MSSRAMQILWFDIQLKSGRSFHFPVSLNIFRELLDCALDLTTLISLGTPKTSHLHSLVRTSCDLIRMLMQFTASITRDGPYHLVDVLIDNTKVVIKVK